MKKLIVCDVFCLNPVLVDCLKDNVRFNTLYVNPFFGNRQLFINCVLITLNTYLNDVNNKVWHLIYNHIHHLDFLYLNIKYNFQLIYMYNTYCLRHVNVTLCINVDE